MQKPHSIRINLVYLIIFLIISSLCACSNSENNREILTETSTETPTTTSTPLPTSTNSPTPTHTNTPTATPLTCEQYFQSVNPVIIVKHQDNEGSDPSKGIRSFILTKSDSCPMSVFENKELRIFLDESEIISDTPFQEEFHNNQGYIRLDFDKYDIPDSESLSVMVRDQNDNELFSSEVLNIAQTGIFKIPKFTNKQSGVTTPQILENREIRVYHVDSIPLANNEITSSFDIGDVEDVKDQCAKPDGIHPEFIHWNAIDYGRCEGGLGSTKYEITYTGPYPITVRKIWISDKGISVYFSFAYEKLSNYPLFWIEHKNGEIESYFIALSYHHLTEIFINEGDEISPGTLIGEIGNFKFNTELHEERGLTQFKLTIYNPPDIYPPIPYKLTLSTEEGNWIEALINEFNGN